MAPLRIHISLDDLPEFETFHSLYLAIRGASWSITNTPLGEPLSDDTREKLLDAIAQVEEALATPLRKERPNMERRQSRRMHFVYDGYRELVPEAGDPADIM
jgi:hypothetical protein